GRHRSWRKRDLSLGYRLPEVSFVPVRACQNDDFFTAGLEQDVSGSVSAPRFGGYTNDDQRGVLQERRGMRAHGGRCPGHSGKTVLAPPRGFLAEAGLCRA